MNFVITTLGFFLHLLREPIERDIRANPWCSTNDVITKALFLHDYDRDISNDTKID
jgi:hypothetical protein